MAFIALLLCVIIVATFGAGAPETVLIDKNTIYVVATYNTLRGAPYGHTYFCDAVAKSYVIKDAWDDEITLVPRDEKFPELENNNQKPPKPPRL